MLRHAKKLEGCELHARDGAMGHVRDFFFDDREWKVRYLVVETGTWLESRKVLIAPAALGVAPWDKRVLPVSLTQEQVRNSPPLDPEQPVTREHERALLHYYQWPLYWSAAGIPELGYAMPIVPPIVPPPAGPSGEAPEGSAGLDSSRPADRHVRSVRGIEGYAIEALGGSVGHVDDFLIDDRTWEVRYLIVDTRNWLPGKKVVLAPQWIREVGWSEAKVFVDLQREAIRASPPFDPHEIVTPDYAGQLNTHYDRRWEAEPRT